MQPFIQPTETIDCDNPRISELAHEITKGASDASDRARQLFYFARDRIRYNPYSPFFLLDHYKASTTLRRGRGYCVQKAVFLVALARAVKLPARLVFADIRNHLAPQNLVDMLDTNLFVFHGYVELLLQERWVKVTPSFERELCEEQRYPAVEFDGYHDAIFPPFDSTGRKYVEYVRHHGAFPDLPLGRILEAWEAVYGREKMETWRNTFHE